MKKLVLALFVVSALAACKKDEETAPAMDAQPEATASEMAPADGTAPADAAPADAPASEEPAAH